MIGESKKSDIVRPLFLRNFMKKTIAIFALALMSFASTASAALVISPARIQQNEPIDSINCTSDDDYYGIYSSTGAYQTAGECDAADYQASLAPGVYTVVVTDADQSGGEFLYEVDPTDRVEVATFQVVPNFADPTAVPAITEGAFTGFLSGIGAFLVANLPAILATLAALIGLGFLITRVRRWIGKKA